MLAAGACDRQKYVTGRNDGVRALHSSHSLSLGFHSCYRLLSITAVTLRSFKKAFVHLGWHDV